jgi:hypothetical protein
MVMVNSPKNKYEQTGKVVQVIPTWSKWFYADEEQKKTRQSRVMSDESDQLNLINRVTGWLRVLYVPMLPVPAPPFSFGCLKRHGGQMIAAQRQSIALQMV